MQNNKNKPWLQYNRPFVRDLAFALACPDILKQWLSPNPNLASPQIFVHQASFWREQYHNYAHRLEELDSSQSYQDLTRYLMNRPSPYRLGFHFEGLIHFWLEDGYKLGLHPYQVLAHNVQLYNGLQTTGELDFILLNQDTGDIEHWELAIKFYLGSAPFDFANWVGINSHDNLQRKLTHMQCKSFRSVWVDLDGYQKVKIDKRYVVMKGRFFLPYSPKSTSIPTKPHWLNYDFPVHTWYNIHQQQDLDKLNDLNYLDIANLRPAHYIEWFTHRPFYDNGFIPINLHLNAKSDSTALTQCKHLQRPNETLTFKNLNTSLYINNGEPLILVIDKQ